MAILTHATVIVEASDTSGSLSQGWEALRIGRPLFLMQSSVDNPNLKWPSEMRDYGAEVLGSEDLDLLLEALPPSVEPQLRLLSRRADDSISGVSRSERPVQTSLRQKLQRPQGNMGTDSRH